MISNFNSGTTVTFPLYVYGVALRGIPVQVNVLATMLFAAHRRSRSRWCIWQQRRAERLAGRLLDDEGGADGRDRRAAAGYRRRARLSRRLTGPSGG